MSTPPFYEKLINCPKILLKSHVCHYFEGDSATIVPHDGKARGIQPEA